MHILFAAAVAVALTRIIIHIKRWFYDIDFSARKVLAILHLAPVVYLLTVGEVTVGSVAAAIVLADTAFSLMQLVDKVVEVNLVKLRLHEQGR